MGKVGKVVIAALALGLCYGAGVGIKHLLTQAQEPAKDLVGVPETEYEQKRSGAAVSRNQAVFYYRAGTRLLNGGKFADAIKQFDQAIARHRNYPDAYANRAYARAALHDPAGAVEDMTNLLKIEPANPRAYAVRAQFRLLVGDPKLALDDYDMAIQLDPNSDSLFCGRAAVLEKAGDYKSAAADYNTALGINPRSTDAYNGLARCSGTLRR
ncbi:MAG TPA: tetratricopeptide repeat protein [Planktothrix sp.]|jgi:tetratricopeptide (TPR) repeat protein